MQRAVGLGQVDVVAGLGADAAGDDRRRVLRVAVPGVDLEVVAEAVRGRGRGADAAAGGAEVDVVGEDVRRAELGVVTGPVVAAVDDASR